MKLRIDLGRYHADEMIMDIMSKSLKGAFSGGEFRPEAELIEKALLKHGRDLTKLSEELDCPVK